MKTWQMTTHEQDWQSWLNTYSGPSKDKMLKHRRETELQGALVLAKSGRPEPGDNIVWTL